MDKDSNKFSVSTSILVGAVIIALSIFFTSDISSSGSRTEAENNQAAAAANAASFNLQAREGAPEIGSGQVVITEFSDFQCPYCQMFWQNAYKQIKAEYIDTGKVKLIFRHYPLPNHPDAGKAAEAAECANDQGKFWEYHDKIFMSIKPDGSGLSLANLKSYAAELNLDISSFNSCLDGGEKAVLVQADSTAGQDAGVGGTPTFFINGEAVVGAQSFATFKIVIDKLLN